MSSSRSKAPPRGFTLVELMVALVVLSIAILPISALVYQLARQSVASSQAQHVGGVITGEAGRLSVVAYDALPDAAGCVVVSSPPFPHERCITVVDLSASLRRVTLIVTPSVPLSRPDTLVFDRGRPATGNPFNTS